nr:MAG TPA: hypothetical protein [Caudoviricetes sp.]
MDRYSILEKRTEQIRNFSELSWAFIEPVDGSFFVQKYRHEQI